MTEYTSLEVSKRLAEARFKECPDAYWQSWPDEDIGWSIGSYDIYATTHIPAYRSDTLLTWMLGHGVCAYVDRKNGIDYVYPYGTDAESVTANTLPDALGEVVLQVLKASK